MLATLSAWVNFWSGDEVRRRRGAEGKSLDCFLQGESWHTPLFEDNRMTPMCRHNRTGALYLRTWAHEVLSERFFLDGGAEVPAHEVGPWLREQSACSNQGLDDPLVFKTYALSAVQELTIEGVTYAVVEGKRSAA